MTVDDTTLTPPEDTDGDGTTTVVLGEPHELEHLEPIAPAPNALPEPAPKRDYSPLLRSIGRWVVAVLGAFAIFGAFMVMKGANPLTAYSDMLTATFGDSKSIGEILIRSAPIILTALAVTVPAKAGLVNVGGEGQLLVGAIAAAGASLLLGDTVPGGALLIIMPIAAMIAGGLWAALTAVLKLVSNINEAVTTLLMNYIAVALLGFLIFDPWKYLDGSGQPATKAIPVAERLPLIGFGRVSAGIVVAIVATGIVWAVLKYTSWGFRLRTVGGNPEAARRAGLRVGTLLISAMFVGGMLAGLGGWVQLSGSEFKLRQGFGLTYGYIGFLASWLARHRPIWVAVSALLLGSIAIGGDSLQLDSKLPAASVNILMAVVLLAVFGFTAKSKESVA
jgi:ABC-type uncharacterized transport system permease subunit